MSVSGTVDPTQFLPEEPMVYELKEKKKKKKRKKDPLEDGYVKKCVEITFEPKIEIKDEVDVDYDEYSQNDNDNTDSQQVLEIDDNLNPPIPVFEASYICFLCNCIFSNEKTLKSHLNKSHKVEHNDCQHHCTLCSRSYSTAGGLRLHIKRIHHEKKKVDNKESECDICNLVFIGSFRLKTHKNRVHGKKIKEFKHICPHCKLSYRQRTSLLTHMKRNHTIKDDTPKLFTCPFCEKIFKIKSSLMTHVKRNHKLKKEVKDDDDDDDDRILSTYKNNTKRKADNTLDNNITKPKADDTLVNNITEPKSDVSLDNNITEPKLENEFGIGDIKQKVIKFEIETDDYFNDSNDDFEPVKVIQSHVCKHCNSVFSNEKTLRSHLNKKHNIEQEDLTFHCKICTRSYTNKTSLQLHIKNFHNKNRKVDNALATCDICHLSFVGSIRLKLHKNRIHGERYQEFNHICAYCDTSYELRSSLVTHIRRCHKETGNEPKQYNCPFCEKEFSQQASLAAHVQRHHKVKADEDDNEKLKDDLASCINDDGKYTCPLCSLVFANVKSLKLHMQRTHDSYRDLFKFQCSVCNLTYENMTSLKSHVQRRHNRSYACKICDIKFDKYDLYLEHIRQTNFTCKECEGLVFATHRMFSVHVNATHKLTNKLYCDVCGKGLRSMAAIKAHVLKDHVKKRYGCYKCEKDFTSNDALKEHLKRKHSEDLCIAERRCRYCCEKFTNSLELANHVEEHIRNGDNMIKTEDGEDDVVYQCMVCPEKFNDKLDLRIHIKSSHKPKKSVSHDFYLKRDCEKCDAIVYVRNYEKHLLTHIELKCNYCDFETTVRPEFTKHMLRHKDVKPLKCDVPNCQYGTYNPLVLERHKANHSAQQLCCNSCDFKTTNKYLFSNHEKEHIHGKRMHACKECDYKTMFQGNLKQHKLKHTSDKKFQCNICDFATKYTTSLRYHIRTKHNDL